MRGDRDADAEVEGQGSQRIDVDSEAPDESETIAPAVPASVAVGELAGPPGLPAPLYDPAPKDEHGRPSWERLHALVVAVEALIGAGMVSEARPLLGQLRGIVEAERGPTAKVIQLGVERSRRDVF